MVRSIFGFCHMSLPHVRGAPGARGPPIERPEHSSFRAVAEASAVISYQPSQGAFAASVPTPTLMVGRPVSAPLLRGSPSGGLARTVGSRCSRRGCPAAPKLHLLSAPPCAAARHPRHRAGILEGWVPSPSSDSIQAIVTRRPTQPGVFHHRHAPDRSRARACTANGAEMPL